MQDQPDRPVSSARLFSLSSASLLPQVYLETLSQIEKLNDFNHRQELQHACASSPPPPHTRTTTITAVLSPRPQRLACSEWRGTHGPAVPSDVRLKQSIRNLNQVSERTQDLYADKEDLQAGLQQLAVRHPAFRAPQQR